MEFLKDLIKIQHQQTLEILSNKLLTRQEDKDEFIEVLFEADRPIPIPKPEGAYDVI